MLKTGVPGGALLLLIALGACSLSEDVTPPPASAGLDLGATATPGTVLAPTRAGLQSGQEYAQASEVAGAPQTLPPGNATAVVTGLVWNGTTREPVPDLEVVLHQFEGADELTPLRTRADSQGRYRIEGVELAPQRTVVGVVELGGVSYFSETQPAEPGAATLDLPIAVYDTSTDASMISIDRLHLFLEAAPGQGILQVGVVAVLSNAGTRTLVAAEEGGGVLFFDLPAQATGLQFQEGSLGARFLRTPSGFADTLAVLPGQGSHQVIFSFELPYSRSTDLQFPLRYPVSGEVLVLPEGMQVESDMLQDSGTQQIQGAPFHLYAGAALLPGQTLRFQVSGKASPPSALEPSTGGELGVGIAALGLVLVGGGLWGWRRMRAAGVERGMPATREALLQAIADLDDALESGEVTAAAHAKRRSALKARLVAERPPRDEGRP